MRVGNYCQIALPPLISMEYPLRVPTTIVYLDVNPFTIFVPLIYLWSRKELSSPLGKNMDPFLFLPLFVLLVLVRGNGSPLLLVTRNVFTPSRLCPPPLPFSVTFTWNKRNRSLGTILDLGPLIGLCAWRQKLLPWKVTLPPPIFLRNSSFLLPRR